MPSDVWAYYARFGETDRSALTNGQRAVLAVCDLRQEVNAGGFDSYLRYWGGGSARAALAALPGLLGQDWANLLREAMQLLGEPYPEDPEQRVDRIDDRDLHQQLADLDERFYALEGSTEADRRMADYIDSHLG